MPSRLVIVGCPGTGKTTTLVTRIGEYRRDNDKPVVFSSHTRAAALAAASKGLGKVDKAVQVGTLHSFCFRHLDMSKAQVVSGPKLWEFCRSVGAPVGKDSEDDYGNDIGDAYLEIMSLARARLQPPEAVYERSNRPGTLAHFESFVKSYNLWKDSHGFVDFSDMLERATKTESYGNVGLLVVDEAQDLTPLHWAVIERIMDKTGCDVVVAGDTDQAINAWSGAVPMGMHDFEKKHTATRWVLPQSHRVPRTIHALAEKVIDRAKVRVDRQYAPKEGVDGTYRRCMDVAELSHEIRPSRDSLVLYADRFQRNLVESELRDAAIGYTSLSGGPAPLDMRGGKALIAAHNGGDGNETIYRGLSDRGRSIWDSIGADPIRAKIVSGDYGVLALAPHLVEYYHRVSKKPPQVKISTIHGAKGLEADEVHLITGQSTAAIEHSWVDADAAHRLFYVGVTRTRNRLVAYDSDGNYELPQ